MLYRLALFVTVLSGAASAAFAPAEWQYRRGIATPPSKGLAALRLDRAVYQHVQPARADIRVVKNGEEVPYVLRTLRSTGQETPVRATVLDRGAAGGALELTLDTGRRARHNRLQITTGERNFRQKVRVEASDDRSRWYVLREEAWIFDFSEEGRTLRSDQVEYPVSTRRFLRISIQGWNASSDVSGADIFLTEQGTTQYEQLAEPVRSVVEDEKCRCTLVQLDAGVAGLPQEWLTIETEAPYFQRAVEIERSDDAKDWRYVDRGVIARLPGEESLRLAFIETPSRYLRLRIYNRDDKPLPIASVKVFGAVRQILFDHDGTPHQLYYGNPKAAAPSYDFAEAVARRDSLSAPVLSLAAEEQNPAYRPPPEPEKPWSERNQSLLYAVLGVAVAVLGYLSFRFLGAASGGKQSG